MKLNQKHIYFPAVKTFRELFTVNPNAVAVRIPEADSDPYMVIGTHFSVDGSKGFYFFKVQPTEMVVEFLKKSLVFIDYDEIYFQAIMRNDGEALITANYNRIIGSRWLALIPHSEIPNEPSNG